MIQFKSLLGRRPVEVWPDFNTACTNPISLNGLRPPRREEAIYDENLWRARKS